MTIRELAAELHISRGSLYNFRLAGCPGLTRRSADLDAVTRWINTVHKPYLEAVHAKPRHYRRHKPWPWCLPGLGYKAACSIIMASYESDLCCMRSNYIGDECHHWGKHPEWEKWSSKMRQRAHTEERYADARLGWKCQLCGCGIDSLKYPLWTPKLKYCSAPCKDKAQYASQSRRYKMDPAFRARRRKVAKRCYARAMATRPEVIKAAVRRKLDRPLFRIAKAFRNRVQDLIKTGRGAKHGRFAELLGCSWDHLKFHLESQFSRGMTWENYGTTWHVDHKLPLASFNLHDPREAAIACNWQNLRPLRAQANQVKSSKIIDPQQPLPLVLT